MVTSHSLNPVNPDLRDTPVAMGPKALLANPSGAIRIETDHALQEAAHWICQVLIRLGSQVMISGKTMHSASPRIISITKGVADL